MTIVLGTPGVDGVAPVVDALGGWQSDDAVFQLHPGDLGWFYRFGADATAAAIRTWSRNGRILAIGLLDGADLLRLTIAPEAQTDGELADQIVADLDHPAQGVLGAGDASVELPTGLLVRDVFSAAGWSIGELWAPLQRDLGAPVEAHALRIQTVTPALVSARVALQRASFERSTMTADGWRDMAVGPPFDDARDLVGFDAAGNAVAAITVWSAGPGRPGLVEPMGVHSDHRGRGYGTAITLAGAAALRDLGSSSAVVCTESSRVGAIATYKAAGFEPLPERTDLTRSS
jgi:ribosomal protein S18 acetylase RimI-like enzyme